VRRETRNGALEESEPQRDWHRKQAADFIRIELELAETFCKLALESHLPERARVHQTSARRALDAVFLALARVEKGAELESTVTEIEKVKALLESLETGGSKLPGC
jgi:hypothetical protein